MVLSEIVERIKRNNGILQDIASTFTANEIACFELEMFDECSNLTPQIISSINNAELDNSDLAILGLNSAIDILEGQKTLDGTYWGAGTDYDYARINGVNRFQSHVQSEAVKAELRAMGIERITFDALKDEHPFPESWQTFALQKTFGHYDKPEYELLWKEIIYAMQPRGLIVTTDPVPSSVASQMKQIEDPLQGFNGLNFFWMSAEINGAYPPKKFDFYRKL